MDALGPWVVDHIRYVPGADPGRNEALVQAPDIRATIMHMMGAEDPGDVHGRSFLPVATGVAESHRDFAFSSGYLDEDRDPLQTRIAVRAEDGWSLHFHPNYEPEVYFIPEDPGETENVFEGNEDQAERLHAAFIEFLREVGAPVATVEALATYEKLG
ncbi:MAG: hypothetical protein R6V07_19660 [Armatimonadota bacterium]